jgi:hypothetical protein
MAPRLVLLHSPLLGPLCWRAVAAELRARGLAAEAPAWPRLSTLGDDGYAALAGSLTATVRPARDTILVAHSGAGPLVPSVAALAAEGLGGVIYCDAILPHPGLSWFDTVPPDLGLQLRAGAEAGRLPAWDRWWPPGALERLLPDPARRRALVEELEPIPVAYFEAPAPDLALDAPAAFLQLSGAYGEEAQLAGRRGWPVVSLPLHHLAMLTHAPAVANAVEGLAQRLGDAGD